MAGRRRDLNVLFFDMMKWLILSMKSLIVNMFVCDENAVFAALSMRHHQRYYASNHANARLRDATMGFLGEF